MPTYDPSPDGNCSETLGFNVRVNQDCLNLSDDDLQGRAQTQFAPAVAADPLHPRHLIAAYQDYRPGDANGEHFTAGQVVGGTSPLCVNQQGGGTPHGNCNANFPTPPAIGPDGALYLISGGINNANALTAPDSFGQILLSKSTDGGSTFSAPVLVGYGYAFPDCAAYQAGALSGISCAPEKGAGTNSRFEVTNAVVGAANPRNAQQIVVSIGSYINADSNEHNGCAPAGLSPQGLPLYTGVKTPGACSNKIVLSVSTDGGATFTGATTNVRNLPVVNTDPRQATTDQFAQGLAFTRDGTLAVSYFDRQYGQDETTGYSDITLSASRDFIHFASWRATSSSMPSPTTSGGNIMSQGFDPLTAVETAHPVWPDTRNPRLVVCPDTGTATTPPSVCTTTATNAAVANEQDIFTANLQVPTP